jgi:LAO/AO transport system kinase
MKAGLMEIADIFVVNKSDRPGADRLVKDLRLALHLREGEALKDVPAHHGVDLKRLGKPGPEAGDGDRAGGERKWEIPVLQTVAQTGEGVEDLLEAVKDHRAFLEESGTLQARRAARAARRVRDVVERELRKVAWDHPGVLDLLEKGVGGIVAGRETPYSLASSILSELLGPGTN